MSDTEGLINKLMSKAELNKPYSKAYREKMTHAVEDMIFSVTAAYKKGKLLASDIPYQLKLSYSKALRQHGVDPEDLIKIAVGFGKFDKETREIFARAKFNVDELPECLK